MKPEPTIWHNCYDKSLKGFITDDSFEGSTVKTTSRKSFFRRLAESKGSPKIDFEEVIIAQKPTL